MTELLQDKLYTEVRKSPLIDMVFDAALRFRVISAGAETEWMLRQKEVEAKKLTDVFPDIVASQNHRNMLRAIHNNLAFNDVIISRSGKIMKISYLPLHENGNLVGLRVTAVPNGQ